MSGGLFSRVLGVGVGALGIGALGRWGGWSVE